MKTMMIKSILPALFVLLSSSAFAGYWKCSQTFLVGDDCLLTVTYEVWWDDETGEIIQEKSSSTRDGCDGGIASFVGNRYSNFEDGYTASYWDIQQTGGVDMTDDEMATLWDSYAAPWMSTLSPPFE